MNTNQIQLSEHLYIINKHFESSQKLLKSSFVNERFKKYLKVPKELLIFKITKFAKTVHMYCKHVLSTPIL